jgi:rSAM/selenodomain-associated transferase 1
VRRPRVLVMAKEPRPGRVKSRLARDIGTIDAVWWYRRRCRDLLRELRDPRWQTVLAVTPDRAGPQSRVWPDDVPRIGQGPGDLGDRMGRLLRSMPPGPVLIVGTDIPGLRRHHIARAFRALGSAEAVIGPATDGGFWLIGLSRTRPVPAAIFTGVRWSTPQARADTIRSLGAARLALVDELQDVDTAADIAAYSG